MTQEELERRTQTGFYYSQKLNLMVQITAAEHPLPSIDDWEFIGSSVQLTSSEAIGRLLQRHPEIDSDRLNFTIK